jgi:ubiquitin conjugation factor E4 B
MDRIDSLYYAGSSRIKLGDETRIKATSEEAQKWEEEHKPGGMTWNFPILILRLADEIYF